jgi:RNA polymerase sigma-70 factor, ECF subfamily
VSASESGVVAELTEDGFAEVTRRYRRELHVHCYRMLGSFDEAEDHVQEVFLRAWRSRDTFHGDAAIRTWLYKIATNACLDTLRRHTRRSAAARSGTAGSVAGMPWLQPYPDVLLEEVSTDQPGPEAAAINKETISLAFLAAIQLLPPRQRAALILRDVLSWSATETAALLEGTVPAINSAVQRARATLHRQWPGGSLQWRPVSEPDAEQRRLLDLYITAHEKADPEALIAVLRDDIRLAISNVGEWTGHGDVADALRGGMNSLGQWRLLPITANGLLGAAGYLRRPGQTDYRPFVLALLRIEHGGLTEISAFEQPSMFAAFGLPDHLEAETVTP